MEMQCHWTNHLFPVLAAVSKGDVIALPPASSATAGVTMQVLEIREVCLFFED
jgi:hypothetical protein